MRNDELVTHTFDYRDVETDDRPGIGDLWRCLRDNRDLPLVALIVALVLLAAFVEGTNAIHWINLMWGGQ